jgi:uncharacterized protein
MNPKEFASRLQMPLSEEEQEELDEFLYSDVTPDETMMLDCLDGYLTAIVIGPTTVQMSDWLPGVWGGSGSAFSVFETQEQAQHILELLMRHMNGIVWSFQDDPDTFEPLFSIFTHPDTLEETLDPEMWAYGFMKGMALCQRDWQPMLEDQEGIRRFHPIRLLGADDISPEEELLSLTLEQRKVLGDEIPGNVAWMYRFWLPYRQALIERAVSETVRRGQIKVGRNDPCPCGSGKKYKHCCANHSGLH